MNFQHKKTLSVPESAYGVCLWEVPSDVCGGGLLAEAPGVFLSIEGVVGDEAVEVEIEKAARYWLEAGPDDYIGQPKWVRGSRKITDNEHDDQMERLLEGHIPDWEEAARIAYLEATRGQ